MFVPSKPLLEIVLRGTVMYLALFGLLRAILHRQAGAVSITDMLLIVLLADASQNAMAAEYRSLPDGILLVATLIFWNYALDWLGYRYPWFRRLVHPSPLKLMRDGQFLRHHMRRELVTEDELRSELRKQGIDDPQQVQSAFMEGDGHISVIKKQTQPDEAGKRAPNEQKPG